MANESEERDYDDAAYGRWLSALADRMIENERASGGPTLAL